MSQREQESARTFSTQYLGNTVLLVEKGLLVHFVEQTAFTIPGRNGLKELLALYLWTNVAHLDNDEGVLAGRTGRKENIGV